MYISFGVPHVKSKRVSKGASLLEALEDYVVVDLETTGLDPSWDSIIELAAVRVEGGIVVDKFQTLVNPQFEIAEFITKLTGITNKMLSTSPDLCDVLPLFISFVGSSVVVGHNVNFDVNFIYDACLAEKLPQFENSFVDTMRLSRRLFKEEAHHRLSDLVSRFGICGNVEHRALSDVMQTYQCYEYIKKFSTDNGIELHSLYPLKKKGGSSKKGVSAKDIKSKTYEFDESTLVFGKLFVFTGALDKMTRKEAMQIVVDMGGVCADRVTSKTNYLVLGNNDYCATIKDGKSIKQKKAEQLKLSGYDLETISEDLFYEMISEVL